MKVKTSITLSTDLLADIDRAEHNRSQFLEKAAWHYLAELAKAERVARDREILDANADRLNREAADVLEYQELP